VTRTRRARSRPHPGSHPGPLLHGGRQRLYGSGCQAQRV